MLTENIKRAIRISHRLPNDHEDDYEETNTRIIDALTDLRHLCDLFELDFAQLDRVAYSHYLEEQRPDPPS